MRSLLLTILLGGIFTSLQARPPGYKPVHHYYTAQHQAYQRLPVRLTAGLNLAYYNGDLTNRLSDNTLRVGVNLGLVKTLSPRLSVGIDAAYVRLKAKDELVDRGLSFEGDNYYLTPFFRYNLFPDKSMYLGMGFKPSAFNIFLQAGIGPMGINPVASLTTGGVTKELPSEVQNGYPVLAATAPVGGGISLRASQSLHFSLEFLYHFTSTDLLDDVNKRAAGSKLDNFATGAFKIEYSFSQKHGKPLVHND